MKINQNMRVNRRNLLKVSAALSSTTLVGCGISNITNENSALAEEDCSGVITPSQTEGPFYPETPSSKWESDQNLTLVEGRNKPAAGEVILLAGRVMDQQCRVIKDARVEIWQADHQGVYQHSQDPRRRDITPDPNFQFFAHATSDSKGNVRFMTIKPGEYPAGRGWIRPPHIHMKVIAQNFIPLTTQIYFEPSENDTLSPKVLAEDPRAVEILRTRGAKEVTTYLHNRDGVLRGVRQNLRQEVVLKNIQSDTTQPPLYQFEIRLASPRV